MSTFAAALRLGLPHRIKPSGKDKFSPLGNADGFIETLNGFLRGFAQKLDAVKADPDLTIAGKAKKMALLNAEAKKELDVWRAGNGIGPQLRGEIAMLEAKAPAVSTDRTDVAGVMLEIERRNWLRSLDQEGRNKELLAAAQTGDVVTMSAFLNAPQGMNLAIPKVLEHVKDELIKAKNPALAADLSQYREVSAIVDDAIADVAQMIDTETLPEMSTRDRLNNQQGQQGQQPAE